MVEHNVPFAVSDHVSPLFHDVFTDSKTAKQYANCKIKTSMQNLAIAPHFQGMHSVIKFFVGTDLDNWLVGCPEAKVGMQCRSRR